MKRRSLLLLLLTFACDANVVDAVREPMPPDAHAGAGPSGSAGSSGAPQASGGQGGEGEVPPSPLATFLFHRYSFDGDGERALDTRGSAHGQVVGTVLTGDGTLSLAGGTAAQYLNLPDYFVSGLTDATFESWLTWRGGGPWQRVFDFGSNDDDADVPRGVGISYLFLTAFAAADSTRQLPAGLRLVYSQNGVADEVVCLVTSRLPVDTLTHVAAVIDSRAQTMSIYQDGALLVECPLTRPLSAINDVNNWLGRSNYAADENLAATYDEFRAYNAALTAEQIAESFALGPNADLTRR
ncbi:MAG: hypothetical protein K0R38_2816 [Polyangiaceae bacterium]|jgi:hypothetical protein|nr:hypothetical protein [Polyangiaceae bacterium]